MSVILLGKRRCLGEALARSSLFLFFTYVIHHFDFKISPEHGAPNLNGYDGFTISPKPYYLILSLRSDTNQSTIKKNKDEIVEKWDFFTHVTPKCVRRSLQKEYRRLSHIKPSTIQLSDLSKYTLRESERNERTSSSLTIKKVKIKIYKRSWLCIHFNCTT